MSFRSRFNRCSYCKFNSGHARWSGTLHVPLILCNDHKHFASTSCGELFIRPDSVLLDSGTIFSLINSTIVSNDVSLYDTYNVHLNTPNGTLIAVIGKITLQWTLEQSTFIHHNFFIRNLSRDVTLGTNLLTECEEFLGL